MGFSKSPPELAALFAELAPDAADIVHKKMFGYPACFVNGNMIAGLHEHRMVFRLGREAAEAAIAAGRGASFEPMAGRPMTGYVAVETALSAPHPALESLMAEAVAHTRALPPK